MVVQSDAVQPAVVDDRCAPVVWVAARPLFEDDGRAPDLPPRVDVDGKRPPPVDHVHDAFVDDRRGELAEFIHHAGVPERHQPLDVGTVDLRQRAVALAVIAHAVQEDVLGSLRVADELGFGLPQRRRDRQAQHDGEHQGVLHVRSPVYLGLRPKPPASACGDPIAPRRACRAAPCAAWGTTGRVLVVPRLNCDATAASAGSLTGLGAKRGFNTAG